jgi:hypothetical protein
MNQHNHQQKSKTHSSYVFPTPPDIYTLFDSVPTYSPAILSQPETFSGSRQNILSPTAISAPNFTNAQSQSISVCSPMVRSLSTQSDTRSLERNQESSQLNLLLGLHTTDDDSRQRVSHKVAEQQRRDNLKNHFKELQKVLPNTSKNITRVGILRKTRKVVLDYKYDLQQRTAHVKMLLQHIQQLETMLRDRGIVPPPRVPFAYRARPTDTIDDHNTDSN